MLRSCCEGLEWWLHRPLAPQVWARKQPTFLFPSRKQEMVSVAQSSPLRLQQHGVRGTIYTFSSASISVWLPFKSSNPHYNLLDIRGSMGTVPMAESALAGYSGT